MKGHGNHGNSVNVGFGFDVNMGLDFSHFSMHPPPLHLFYCDLFAF